MTFGFFKLSNVAVSDSNFKKEGLVVKTENIGNHKIITDI